MTEHTYAQEHLELPITGPVNRIVSLVPSMTESLFDLGLGDFIVGITEYCIYPKGQLGHLTRIGGTKKLNLQQIIDLQPELVIANREENSKHDIEALQAAGLPVWVTFPKTVADVFNILWNIMYVFDETSMVSRIRLIEYTYDRILNISELKEEEAPCRVFAPIWYDPLMTFNAQTYAHDVLRVVGGINVFAERQRLYPLSADLAETPPREITEEQDTRYPRITLAEVEQAQPDVILLPSEPYKFTQEHISIFAELDVPAAKNNRIHLIDGALLTWHGTHVAYALNELPLLMCE